ncbi:MAG: hypothetical protein CVV00_01675 [Firmicutes bacterium HGW-Firmicutes-5]|nr:MAG: hypothetical protein CVV00_01675 [Firmicutes bacterium HGW-Firmicutes-5]
MYNLFISGDEEAWINNSYILDRERCLNVKEYTSKEIVEKFGSLTENQISEIKKLPCIFAYETHCKKNPRFGYLTDIICRQDRIRFEIDFIHIPNFITYDTFLNYDFDLDITSWAYNRTHWAIKDVDLYSFLNKIAINIPNINYNDEAIINVSKHHFKVAFTFPGEVRQEVENIVMDLGNRIGRNSIFYDNYYKSQLARPNLDLLLQDIYRNRSDLIVVFLCEHYQQKEWCNLEFRAVRDIIKAREHDKIMFIKMDNGTVDGVFSTDGYIDAKAHRSSEICNFIEERILLLNT